MTLNKTHTNQAEGELETLTQCVLLLVQLFPTTFNQCCQTEFPSLFSRSIRLNLQIRTPQNKKEIRNSVFHKVTIHRRCAWKQPGFGKNMARIDVDYVAWRRCHVEWWCHGVDVAIVWLRICQGWSVWDWSDVWRCCILNSSTWITFLMVYCFIWIRLKYMLYFTCFHLSEADLV